MADRKSSLTPSRRRLLTELQRINYGRIEGLKVRQGSPVLDPLPRIVREHKFGAENGPRLELTVADFLLKRQVTELFVCLDQLQDGDIEVLEIKAGLPFRMLIREAAA